MNIRIKTLVFFCFFLLNLSTLSAQVIDKSNIGHSKIQLRIELQNDFTSDSVRLGYDNTDFVISANFKQIKTPVHKQEAYISINSDEPILIDLSAIMGKDYTYVLFEPGDSTTINLHGKMPLFTGRGSQKHKISELLRKNLSDIQVPGNPHFNLIISVSDFREWVNYIHKQELLVDSIFRARQNELTPFSRNYMKAINLAELGYFNVFRFAMLSGNPTKYGLRRSDLSGLFDSTFNNSRVKWLHDYDGKTYAAYYYYEFARQSALKKVAFDLSNPSVIGFERTTTYYNQAKLLFTGSALQNTFTYIITSKGIKEYTFKNGFMQDFEGLLATYYRDTKDLRHINHVREYDAEVHNWLTGIGTTGYNFSLPDTSGKPTTKDGFKGKVVVLNFWKSACKKCELENQALFRVQKEFQANKNVVFINISTDKNRKIWLSELKKQGLEHFGINTYTNGLGTDHPIVRGYNVTSYPTMFLYDGNGVSLVNPNNPAYAAANLVYTKFPDPNKDSGKALIDKIRKEIPKLSDGPYVFDSKDSLEVFSILSGEKNQLNYRSSQVAPFKVLTDQYEKTFQVKLQKDQETQKTTHNKPEKLIALSDIEGNFDSFRKLLQSNAVIDTNYNWVFGKGHLVFAGDMFDRGQQVTECLWLIYSLEEQAKLAGGCVHFVLGNHEIMNLQGDHLYANAKYKRSAKLIGKTITQLYGEDSELGKWLRTKNVVEKIGDLLFTHGGISAQLIQSGFRLEDINRLARPNYALGTEDYKDARVNLVMSQTYGPFWFRGYYPDKPNEAVEPMIDSVLNTYKVKHIVTGHTIIADTVSTLYHNKVINTDTKHKDGKSEALLIEGNSFFRVNDKGQRWLLFKDPEDSSSPMQNKNK